MGRAAVATLVDRLSFVDDAPDGVDVDAVGSQARRVRGDGLALAVVLRRHEVGNQPPRFRARIAGGASRRRRPNSSLQRPNASISPANGFGHSLARRQEVEEAAKVVLVAAGDRLAAR